MKSFSFVMTTPAFADRKPERAAHAVRASYGARTMSLAAGVLLALVSVGHGQSRINTLSRGEPSTPRAVVEQQLVSGANARQLTTVLADRPSTDQSRGKDYLYDEIMLRAGVPLKDLRWPQISPQSLSPSFSKLAL
jgi:hypothetical protein